MEPAATRSNPLILAPATGDASVADADSMKLSEVFVELAARFQDSDVSVGEVVVALKGRAFLVLLLVFSLPFCTPIPLPGISTPFGLLISVIGLRLALRQRPWLPGRLLAVRLSRRFFPRVLRAAGRIVRGIERVSRQRIEFLADSPVMQHLSGALIFLCGALLLLPLPIPFSNLFPAATIALLAIGRIGRDGVFVIAGLAAFTATCFFFGMLAVGGAAVARWITEHFHGWFEPGDEPIP